jgi:signal transduction histidine kinase
VIFAIVISISILEVVKNGENQRQFTENAVVENKLYEMRFLVASISSWQITYSMKNRLEYASPESITNVRRAYLASLDLIKQRIGEIENTEFVVEEKDKLESIKDDLNEFEKLDTEILQLYGSKKKEDLTQADFLVLGISTELANRMSKKMSDLTIIVKENMTNAYNENSKQIYNLNIAKYIVAIINILLAAFAIYQLNILITKERTYKKSFLQMQKMEAIGRLSGGIAHDFNNLLTVIIGQADLLSEELEENPKQSKKIKQILKASKKAADLTGHLLLFSKKQSIRLEILDVNQIINDYEEILQRLIGEDIKLVFNLSATEAFANTNQTQLQQVLMNLVINAKDAMPNGGKITIETLNIKVDEVESNRDIMLEKDDYIMIGVSDTGIGMDEDTKSKIFEPFYTTKAGKGTGLGLATVFGIATQMGGKVNVYSELGLGTSFKIYFPQTSPSVVQTSQPKANEISDIWANEETVLVVEDNEPVREFTVQSLVNYGYKIISAKDGNEALKIFGEKSDSINLVISDIIMPEINGVQLAKEILKIKPKTSFLFMSGYTDGAIKNLNLNEAGIPFIQKPFTAKALAEAVKRITS